MIRLLVCGTRSKKDYKMIVYTHIANFYNNNIHNFYNEPMTIIEGCCPDSADVYAEQFWKEQKPYIRQEGKGIVIRHFPSTSGNYLKRNIEMVNNCDYVMCFYDGWSYGSAHTVANAIMKGKQVIMIDISKVIKNG